MVRDFDWSGGGASWWTRISESLQGVVVKGLKSRRERGMVGEKER